MARATSCSTRCARTDADVYLTSDLRHHPASEFREHGVARPLVDVAHWAAEWTWLPVLQRKLADGAGRYGGDPREHDAHGPVDLPAWTTMHQETPLKADPFAQLKLLDVQELDSRLDGLAHQLRTMPEIAQLREIEAQRKQLDDRGRDLRIAVDDLTAEQRKADADVEQVKTRRERDRSRMDQGLITNPKDLERMGGELSRWSAGSPRSRTPSSR